MWTYFLSITTVYLWKKKCSDTKDLRNSSIRYKRYHLAIYSARYRNPTAEIPSGFAWRQKRAVPICWISAKNAAVLAETCRGKHKRWDFVHILRSQVHVKGSTPDRRLANDTWCRSCAKSTGNPEKELYLLERRRTAASSMQGSCIRRRDDENGSEGFAVDVEFRLVSISSDFREGQPVTS